MVSYRKLWKTMKERGISQYALYTRYGISTSFLDKLRHNENVEIRSLDILCSILKCDFGDIVEHIPDETESKEQ
ncbi:XRE family transcriptional regulator [Ruminococcus sp. AF37-6AT]|nr:XRE family transcriptional regulator [Ruminococcus sp. AM07-21]RHL49186.1 XRE family transcriptional regulator [Ruminococcus sp. AF37-6AT]RHP55076.1 XRE family transcriptional regulator [Ruminococcus sp. AF31-16BH]